MRVLIVAKEEHENAMKLAEEISDLLESKGGTVCFDRLTAEKLGIENMVELKDADADFVLVLGGDGTLLWTESKLDGRLPIFGINFGSTGFLTEVGYRDWKGALERILKNEFSIEERSKISVNVNGDKIGDALNEAVVKSSLPVEML
ncbi:MAG: NAD(+)/NADH kinase, partial [Candidatus Hydrothermarchaeales archaeon]